MSNQLKEQVYTTEKEALAAFQAAGDRQSLYDQKVKFLGKQGTFSNFMREFGKLPPVEKPAMGQLMNEVKGRLEEAYTKAEQTLKRKEMAAVIEKEKIDLTLPGKTLREGGRHPISVVMQEIAQILGRVGFSVRTGPLIEKDVNNFTKLNIPEDHPARDLQDTFYVDSGHVLRTHTSPIQVRTMESEKPPFRVLAPGTVFRSDSDISHSPNFHQIEGLLIDKNVSMAHLKATLTFFVNEFFGKGLKTRFRPSYFQFTEPSAEFDCSCPICKGRGSVSDTTGSPESKGCRMCKGSGWIEIGGCGLVNPKVLQACGLDPEEWQGFAFGFGVERMAIIKYGIDEIRHFYENDVRFLRQFQA